MLINPKLYAVLTAFHITSILFVRARAGGSPIPAAKITRYL